MWGGRPDAAGQHLTTDFTGLFCAIASLYVRSSVSEALAVAPAERAAVAWTYRSGHGRDGRLKARTTRTFRSYLIGLIGAMLILQKIAPVLKEPTPSFFDIAARPTTTAQGLRSFLQTTHWDKTTFPMAMPRLRLNPEQIDAVTCYILNLRQNPEDSPASAHSP